MSLLTNWEGCAEAFENCRFGGNNWEQNTFLSAFTYLLYCEPIPVDKVSKI